MLCTAAINPSTPIARGGRSHGYGQRYKKIGEDRNVFPEIRLPWDTQIERQTDTVIAILRSKLNEFYSLWSAETSAAIGFDARSFFISSVFSALACVYFARVLDADFLIVATTSSAAVFLLHVCCSSASEDSTITGRPITAANRNNKTLLDWGMSRELRRSRLFAGVAIWCTHWPTASSCGLYCLTILTPAAGEVKKVQSSLYGYSSSQCTLHIPDRIFWNSLPLTVRDPSLSLTQFARNWKLLCSPEHNDTFPY